MVRRRHCLGAAAAAALLPRVATGTTKPAPLPLLRIYIPGGTGGGWDQTGRALGAAMQSAELVQRVEYENKGGKGGTVGLADFVERYDRDPAALLVGGMVMVGALAVAQPKVTLAQVTPLARLTNDYMVLVTPADSRLTSLKGLTAELQKNLAGVVFTGGSLGGVDHMLAGMIVRLLRLDTGALRYEPTTSGTDALALLRSGKAQVAISGYSEFKTEIDKKSVVALAASSRRGLHGIASLSEQGVPTELANWRGVFAPGGIPEERKEALRQLVIRATETPAWRQTLTEKDWIAALLHGKDFAQALEIDQGIAAVVTLMLKLKA